MTARQVAEMLDRDPTAAALVKEYLSRERLVNLLELRLYVSEPLYYTAPAYTYKAPIIDES